MTLCDILATSADALQNTGWGSLALVMATGEWLIVIYIFTFLVTWKHHINKLLKHGITSTGLCTKYRLDIVFEVCTCNNTTVETV